MTRFELTIFDGHPLMHDGDNLILVDTGSPVSIHKYDCLNFMSEDFQTSVCAMGTTVEAISKCMGTQVTTLMGADILSKYKILFDYKSKEIFFSLQDVSLDGYDESKISVFMGGISIVELAISGKKMKFFLDTGAKLSYISDEISCNYSKMGIKEDFYPGLGAFQTPYCQIETSVFDKKFIVNYGSLPAQLRPLLVLGGVDGIIGFDFFDNFKVLLDITNKRLLCK
jgi:hypothetical protein